MNFSPKKPFSDKNFRTNTSWARIKQHCIGTIELCSPVFAAPTLRKSWNPLISNQAAETLADSNGVLPRTPCLSGGKHATPLDLCIAASCRILRFGNPGTITPNSTATPADVTRAYNGTASVGDFLTITLDTTTLTISYSNLSNGDSGSFPYTVNADGSYTLNDPNGNLLSAYEIPGYALLIQAAKAGPNHNTSALITAVETGPISLTTFSGNSYNYIQFRTAAGGLEVGSVSIAGTSGTNSSYWPYGHFSQGSGGTFNSGALDFSQMKEASSGNYIYGPDGGGGTGDDYIFGTASGFFIVDTPNGSIIGLPKAASSAFDPSVAGTYNGVFYSKVNAQTGAGNVETGTASTSQATIVVTA